MRCWKCGAALNAGEKIFRNSTCASCGADLHSCKGCRFYEPGAHYDCRETVEEQVTEKTRANFCDFFAPRENDSSVASGVNAGAIFDGANAAANVAALFGGAASDANFAANSSRAENARAAFNNLFGD